MRTRHANFGANGVPYARGTLGSYYGFEFHYNHHCSVLKYILKKGEKVINTTEELSTEAKNDFQLGDCCD